MYRLDENRATLGTRYFCRSEVGRIYAQEGEPLGAEVPRYEEVDSKVSDDGEEISVAF